MKLADFFRFFSHYEGPFEKKVDRFLKKIRQKSKADLELLMQKDLMRLTVFLEYKFKGYKKLKKRYRRRLYESGHLIRKDFKQFYVDHEKEILARKQQMSLPDHLLADPHFDYLLVIMNYLRPGQRLKYRESATFENLLRDPSAQQLVGDCNQITTMYVYLFSLLYPIGELQVKILPEHICLHYKGQDIETTNGQLANYDEYTFIAPVTEIVPTNILDVSDPEERQFDLSAKSMLKAAELAYQFSGHRQTVEKNLFTAYHNLAIYYAKIKDFKNAKLYANKSGHTKLQRDITRMEAAQLLKEKRYQKAAELFKRVADRAGEKACYQNELADLLEKLKGRKTVEDYKRIKPELRRMKELALKLDNQKLVSFVNKIFVQFK